MCMFLVCDWLKKSNIFDQSQTTLNGAHDILDLPRPTIYCKKSEVIKNLKDNIFLKRLFFIFF